MSQIQLSRRNFLVGAGAVSLGFGGLHRLFAATNMAPPNVSAMPLRYGPLKADPAGLFDLPDGFSYKIVSRAGKLMTDGFLTPGKPDGMATFAAGPGQVIVVRNHELNVTDAAAGPFGPTNAIPAGFDQSKIYDLARGVPCAGGTTSFVWDLKEQALVSDHASLMGTIRNCAGGPTPWGSWVTCEETVVKTSGTLEKDHGYNFDVPATASGIATPIALKAMGRFNHEAIAVNPLSGIVYQTEDDGEGLIYRFIPTTPGKLSDGGRLQALVVTDKPSLDTRNWTSQLVARGELLNVQWIDMTDVESPNGDLRYRGFAAGAARFARGEGMWYGNNGIYFACTNGGPLKKGQIWKYTPSPNEGTATESTNPGKLELFIQSADAGILENCDNLCVAPWGDLALCEDGPGSNHLIGVTPKGEIYKMGRNAVSDSEVAGCTFSPDGSTLFVNIQQDGYTLAITGPWQKGNG